MNPDRMAGVENAVFVLRPGLHQHMDKGHLFTFFSQKNETRGKANSGYGTLTWPAVSIISVAYS